MPRNGYAVQCRITTEDPANKFTPDYGRILSYRSAAGLGIRLDGAMGDTGAVITPFYDSLLVKVTAYGPKFPIALQRMDRALREFRIRGRQDQHPVPRERHRHPVFRAGGATTNLIDTTPALFEFKGRRDRATRLLAFLGDVIVNGNPQVRGRAAAARRGRRPPSCRVPACDRREAPPPGTRDLLRRLRPGDVRPLDPRPEAAPDHRHHLPRRPPVAPRRARAHATTCSAPPTRSPAARPGLFSLECWGGATFDTALRFLHEDPYQRLALPARAHPQHLLPDAPARRQRRRLQLPTPTTSSPASSATPPPPASTSSACSTRSTTSRTCGGALEAVLDSGALCEAAICYTGDLLDPAPQEVFARLLRPARPKELERLGVHLIAIKDMAGLCKPAAAAQLVRALKDEVGVPIHFHTHDTSGIAAASVLAASAAGADIVDLAIAAMSGSTSQPNLNSIVAALEHTRRAHGPRPGRALNEFSRYWEARARRSMRRSTRARAPAAPRSTSTRCPAASTPT